MFLLFTFVFVSANAGGNFTIKTIVIDAGHGGKDPGATGPGKTNEKDVALAVALKLGDYIQKNFPDVNVIYTRKTDVFIELHERAEIANKNKADLFIAVHCNSSTTPVAYGTSTYVLGLHRTEANLEVAKRENSVILLEDDRDKNYEFDPNTPEGHIIMSMKQNAFLDQSIDIASKIESQYETGAKRKSLGVKQAGFYVIYKTAMPSLLSEIGFISNPTEEKFLASEKGQDQIANSLFKAFKDYKFEMENSEGEQFAYQEAKRKAQNADSETSKQPAKTTTKEVKQTVDKPVAEKPAEVEKPVAEKETQLEKTTPVVDPDNLTVTLLSGRKIKKPIDNASGGGTAPVAEKPQETSPAKTEPVKPKTEDKPVAKVEKPKPVEVKKEEHAPVEKTEPVASENPAGRKVTAGKSGGDVDAPAEKPAVKETKTTTKVETEVVEEKPTKTGVKETVHETVAETKPVKTETKPVVAETKPVKTEPKPVNSETKTVEKTTVTKTEEEPVAVSKPVKIEPKPVVAESKPVKTESKPVKTETKTVEKTTVTKTEEKPVAVTKPVVKPAPKVEEEPANDGVMTFKVQLIALKGPMKADAAARVSKQLGEVSTETIPSGLVRNYAGYSKTYSEAKRKVAIAVELGYKDAFIVGFKNGVRFGPEKLKSYENQ